MPFAFLFAYFRAPPSAPYPNTDFTRQIFNLTEIDHDFCFCTFPFPHSGPQHRLILCIMSSRQGEG